MNIKHPLCLVFFTGMILLHTTHAQATNGVPARTAFLNPMPPG